MHEPPFYYSYKHGYCATTEMLLHWEQRTNQYKAHKSTVQAQRRTASHKEQAGLYFPRTVCVIVISLLALNCMIHANLLALQNAENFLASQATIDFSITILLHSTFFKNSYTQHTIFCNRPRLSGNKTRLLPFQLALKTDSKI